MREIKFRAWNNIDKKIVQYCRLKALGVFALHHQLKAEEFLVLPTNEQYELMQYTGLKDKNGVEIYEGDKVKAINMSHDHTLPSQWVGEVRYGRNNCCWGITKRVDVSINQDGSAHQEQNIPIFNFINFNCGIVPDMDFEVIGNIYE